MANKVSKVVYCNKTGHDIRDFHAYIVANVVSGTPLPEEVSDLLTVEIIEVEDGLRGIVDWK